MIDNIVHRESRDKLAVALRLYLSGKEGVDEINVDCRDRGAVAVKEMYTGCHTYIKDHLWENSILSEEGQRRISCWISFLESDQVYVWPEQSLYQKVNWPMNIITFGLWEKMKRRKTQRFIEFGDYEVWPFVSKDEYRNEKT